MSNYLTARIAIIETMDSGDPHTLAAMMEVAADWRAAEMVVLSLGGYRYVVLKKDLLWAVSSTEEK